MEHTLYSVGNYSNRSINNCSNRRPSNPFFVKPYTSERKEKFKNHYISVNEVLERWSNVKPCLLDSKDSLYTTCIPLYLNVSDQLKLVDHYEEAIQHLKSSKRYENPYKAYTQINELEAKHNQDVSNFMNNTENRIKMLIDKDEEISLKENSIYRGKIHELRESDFKLRVSLDDRMGYYLSNIFDHFKKQAINRQNNILCIDDKFNEFGYNCPILHRSDSSPDEFIAMSNAVNKAGLRKLKILIESEGEAEETIHRLGEFEQNIHRMRELLNDFHSSIQEISHNILTLGLKGQCKIEHELSYHSMFISDVKSLFFH
jgi:hypothetical protein